MTQIDPTTPEGIAYWQQRHNYEAIAEVAADQRGYLQGENDRLRGENEHLRNELAVLRRALADLTEHVFDAAQAATHAAQLGRMLTDDQGEPEQ